MSNTNVSQLKRDAARGVRWNAVNAGVITALNFVRTAILARFLGPDAFGEIAIVGVFLSFAEAIGTFGIVSSVIRTPKFVRGELAALFLLQLLLTIAVFLIVITCAGVWSSFQPESAIPSLLAFAASAIPIAVLGAVHRALSQRDLKFRFLALVNIGSDIVATVTAVLSVIFFDQGVWAFIWGNIAKATTGSVCLVLLGGYARQIFAERPKFTRLSEHIPFGLHITGSLLLNKAGSELDKLIIGGMLGTTALGYYTIALSLTTMPLRKINPIITQVALPVFAKLDKNTRRITDGYLRAQELLVQTIGPLLVGLAALAPVFIPLYLGAGWEPVIPFVQIFAIYGISRTVANTGGPVAMALGRTRSLLIFVAVGVSAQLLTIYLCSLSNDLLIVVWAMSILHPLLVIGQYRFVLYPLLGSFWKSYLNALRPGLVAAGTMYFGLRLLEPALSHTPAIVHLVTEMAIGALSYITVLFMLDRNRLANNLLIFFNKTPPPDKQS